MRLPVKFSEIENTDSALDAQKYIKYPKCNALRNIWRTKQISRFLLFFNYIQEKKGNE